MIIAYNKVTKQLTHVEHTWLLKPAHEWIANPIIQNWDDLTSTKTEFWVYEENTNILRVMTLSEMDTNVDRVNNAKQNKIAELSSACEQDIIKGFESDALGVIMWYDSSAVDQLNLMSAITISSPTDEFPNGTATFFACRSGEDAIKEYQTHTYMQLKKIAQDQAKSRISHLQRFSLLRQQVLDMSSVSQISSIEWEES